MSEMSPSSTAVPGLPEPTPFAPGSADLPHSLTPDAIAGEPLVLLVAGADDIQWAADAAISIAAAWADAGSRIVLADLHLEEPVLHERLGEPNREGVVDICLYGASVGRSARPLKAHGFFLIPAGTYTAAPEAIYAEGRWGKIVAGFREAGATLLAFVPAETEGFEDFARHAKLAVVLGTPSATGKGFGADLQVLAALAPPRRTAPARRDEEAVAPLPAPPLPEPESTSDLPAELAEVVPEPPVLEAESALAPPNQAMDDAPPAVLPDELWVTSSDPDSDWVFNSAATEELAFGPPAPVTAPVEPSIDNETPAIEREERRLDEEGPAPWQEPPVENQQPGLPEEESATRAGADRDAEPVELESVSSSQHDRSGEGDPDFLVEALSHRDPPPGRDAHAGARSGTPPVAPVMAHVDPTAEDESVAFRPAVPPRRQSSRSARSRRRRRSGPGPLLWVILVAVLLVAAALIAAALRPDLFGFGAPNRSGIGTVAAEPVPPPPAAAVAVGDTLAYVVQVRAFVSAAAANQLARQQAQRLPETRFFVVPEATQGVVYHKVMAGLLRDSMDAMALRQRLVDRGVVAARDAQDYSQGSAWNLIQARPLAFYLGEFRERSEALAQVDSFRLRNISAYPVALPYSDGTERWRLYAGAFPDSLRAEELRQMLRAAELPARLVVRIGQATATP